MFRNVHLITDFEFFNIDLCEKTVILGTLEEDRIENKIFDAMITLTKWAIGKSRNIIKYQMKQKTSRDIIESVKTEIKVFVESMDNNLTGRNYHATKLKAIINIME